MEEMKEKVKDICKMKETLINWCECAISQGMEQCDGEELGEAIDMVKDLAEAEKYCMESCYYMTVVEAMKNDQGDDRYGYNPNHSSRTGRFVSGYMPMEIMGYSQGTSSSSGGSNSGSAGYDNANGMSHSNNMGYRGVSYNSDIMGYHETTMSNPMMNEQLGRYGREYNEYKNARRHYHETHQTEDERKMHEHANAHISDSITTIREIWKDADPELKRRIKTDLSHLVNEMGQ